MQQLQQVETASSSMHHTKMVSDERDNRQLLSNCGGPDLVLNSANLIPFDHI